MISLEKTEYPSSITILAVTSCVCLITLFLQPRLKNVLFSSFINPSPDSELTGQQRWMFNDLLSFGYRFPTNTVISNTLLTQNYPAIANYTFAQVSILQSNNHYSIDLVPSNELQLQQVSSLLGMDIRNNHTQISRRTKSGISVARIYSPHEASQANGYYFEDKSLADKFWINVSYYEL